MELRGLFGILFLLLFAYLLSEQRRALRWRTPLTGLALQLLLAWLLLKLPLFQSIFLLLNQLALALETATQAGTAVVFGFLGGAPLPYNEALPGASFVLATRALPLVLVISALSSLLFYWGLLPKLVRLCSFCLRKTLRVSGVVGVGAAANIFVGMVEAPLLVRPYLQRMSRSELFALMVCGMSTIAGTVLVLYASILQQALPDALGHILTASIISAPAAITIAQLMVPGRNDTAAEIEPGGEIHSSIDAITSGTLEGIRLLVNIVAMLIVLVALVALANQILGLLPDLAGAPLSLQRITGLLAAPLVWLLGVPWEQAPLAGSLLGTKVILNEFVAYLDLAALPTAALDERSRLIMIYALCGFANFGSLGIMIGGMGAMAPQRRQEIIALGPKSILAGLMATCMTGAIVGLLY